MKKNRSHNPYYIDYPRKNTGHSKKYIVTATNGYLKEVTNLRKWCRENGLNKGYGSYIDTDQEFFGFFLYSEKFF